MHPGREFVIFPQLHPEAWQAVKDLLKDSGVLKVFFAMDHDVKSMQVMPTPVLDVRSYAESYGLHHGVGLTRMYEHVTKSRISVLPKEKYRKCPVGGDHSLLPYRVREMHTESGSRQLNLAGLAAR